LPPQRGTQWEGGVKAELLDKRLVATFAYFDIVKSNILAAAYTGGYDTPIGQAESKGVEFDLKGQINDNWSLIATYANTAAFITKDTPAAGVFAAANNNTGHRLQNVPRNQGSIWLKYTAQGQFSGLNLGGGVVAVGERPGDNQNDFTVPGYARVDVFGSYRLPLPAPYPKTTLQLNVNNLFGTRYFEGTTFERYAIYPGAPRSFILSLRAEY
jgi:iron complex outermembrane recepter protein